MSRTWRVSVVLAPGGGLAFWLANLAISLTPLAAEYRAALSIPYIPMLVEALFGGVVLGFCVSYAVVRRAARIPLKSPVAAGMAMSVVALAAVTLIVDLPAKLLTPLNDPVRYLLIAALFNALRILALGATVGWLYGRMARAQVSARPSPELQR
ncbi:MAG: hypothetical protein ACOH16_08715 [Propionibacteriaceae bacterium]